MSAIQILAAQPWVERLALTLLHFTWQGSIVFAVYATARRLKARTLDPGGRCSLACLALIAMALAPTVTWIILCDAAPQSIAATFTAPLSAARPAPLPPISLALPDGSHLAAPEPLLLWVVALWLTGATALSIRLLGNWILAQRLRHIALRPASAEWQKTLNRLKARISISRPVRLFVSGLLRTPAVMGWLRPIVLVPAGALAGLPPAQIEALLLHELAHVRRHDYLINLLQSALESVFFYHPAVWCISGHLRTERELCCDDIAVSITGDALNYARALGELASAPWLQSAAIAANGGPVADRIARLLAQPSTSRHAPSDPPPPRS